MATVFGTAIVVALLLAFYWLPTIVATRRRVPGRAQIVVVNLFLGWTMVGWVVALVMAFRQVPHTGGARYPALAPRRYHTDRQPGEAAQ